jgi:hypothetical protein
MRPREDYSWKSIDRAPLNEDVTLQVTDGRGEPYLPRKRKQTYCDRLGQFWQGNATYGHASEVETIFSRTQPPASMTARRTELSKSAVLWRA